MQNRKNKCRNLGSTIPRHSQRTQERFVNISGGKSVARSPSLARKDAGAKRRGKEEVAGTQRRENVLKHPACSLHLP